MVILVQRQRLPPCATSAQIPALRLERQSVRGFALHRFPGIEQREIAANVPQLQKVGIVRAAGLSALTGRVDDPGAIPVAEVNDLPIARTGYLIPGIAHAGGIGRVLVPRTRQRSNVEQVFRAGLLVERVTEANNMKFAPCPL